MPASRMPFLIMVAPNGARRTQADHPNLPVTPVELARVASACLEAGAGAMHLHVRDREQRHVLDADAYIAALAEIRRAVGDRLLLQITTEAVGRYSPFEQQAVVRAVKPESVSVALREMIPESSQEISAGGFYAWCRSENIAVQHILYDADDVVRFQACVGRGIIPADSGAVLFVLGRYLINRPTETTDLIPFLNKWGEGRSWSVCCFGQREGATSLTSALLGGHCRVGFENNLETADGRRADGNEDLVAQVASGLAQSPLVGRSLASADDARTLGF